MARGFVWVAALAAGCSWSTDKYVREYVEAECVYRMACYDEAVLEFYGYGDEQGCIDALGPEITERVSSCATYDPKAGKQCVKALRDATCPPEGEDPTSPAICEAVFGDCGADTDTTDTDQGS